MISKSRAFSEKSARLFWLRNDWKSPPLRSGDIQRKIYFYIGVCRGLRAAPNAFSPEGRNGKRYLLPVTVLLFLLRDGCKAGSSRCHHP
jgi:hypothetical protein